MINQNMEKEKGFRGIFCIDTLPEKMKKFENGIINLDISTGPGTHWVCYYNDNKYNFVEYFDPFGEYKFKNIKFKDVIIPEPIQRYLKTCNKEIRYNNNFIQDIISTKCGLYCMKYIIERNRGKSPIDVLYSFTQKPSKKNENFVLYK